MMRSLDSGGSGGGGGVSFCCWTTTTGLLRTLLAFIMAISLVEGLKCLSCRGQTVYECFMSAEDQLCQRGEDCRFRMLHDRFIPTRTKAWVEAGCATREQCRTPSIFYMQFCCRYSYCNFFPMYMK